MAGKSLPRYRGYPSTGRSHQQGFTLVQAVIVVGLMSFMAVRMLPIEAEKFTDRYVIGATRMGVEQLAQAAVAYRSDVGQTWYGTWPANPATLSSRGYLPGFTNRNGRGRPYTFSASGSGLRIATMMDSVQEARMIAGAFGGVGSVSGTAVRVTIPPPGQESSHSELYALDGSRALTGTMNANGQNINNIGIATANSVQASTYYDKDNTSYYLNPNSTSRTYRMDATAQMRSPVYYDSANTAYYGDFNSRSQLNTLDVRSIRDKDNTSYYLDPNSTSRTYRMDATAQMRSPIYYDSDNTAYYLNPAGTSTLFRPQSSRTPTTDNDLANKKYVDTQAGVTVRTGTIDHGQTIPLPPGFTNAQCTWMVSPRTFGGQDGGGMDWIQAYATSTRSAFCRYSMEDRTWWQYAGNCEYIIICS